MSILLKYYFKNTVKRKKETIGLPALRGGKTPQKLLLEGKKKTSEGPQNASKSGFRGEIEANTSTNHLLHLILR